MAQIPAGHRDFVRIPLIFDQGVAGSTQVGCSREFPLRRPSKRSGTYHLLLGKPTTVRRRRFHTEPGPSAGQPYE